MHGFLRYLFHIQIRNSRNLGKCIPQYVVAHYFLRELYITSANRTNFGLPKCVCCVPKPNLCGCAKILGLAKERCNFSESWIYIFITTFLESPRVEICLQYRYFCDGRFLADTIHISVIEAQLGFVGGVICYFDKALSLPIYNDNMDSNRAYARRYGFDLYVY